MYKLNIDHLTDVKYENTPQHGLFSGTIETDRVVLVDGDGKYLQVDGNFGTDLKIGLVRTYSATRDSAETTYKIATTDATTTAAVYCYADVMVLQSDYADVDAFIEYLVDSGVITIDDFENPKYELKAATVKAAGSGYTNGDVDVEVPGETGDTAGVVTVTISSNKISAVAIKSAGSYEKMVATQDLDVAGGTGGKITVTMQEISEADAKGPTRSVEEPETTEEPKTQEVQKQGKKSKSEPVEETVKETEETVAESVPETEEIEESEPVAEESLVENVQDEPETAPVNVQEEVEEESEEEAETETEEEAE